jgi:hypothetical protein
MKGQKDAGQKFYQIMYKYMKHIGLKRSISDNGVFIWKHPTSEMFLAIAMDDCLILRDDRAQFLDLKNKIEALFEVTLQEGYILRFLDLHIIQSPAGISIDQTDHIVETIIEPYYKDTDTSTLLSITSIFPNDSSVDQCLYEASVLTGPALKAIELKHGGSLYHWNGALLHVSITSRVEINYAIMRIAGYIFEGLAHMMLYLYHFHHVPIMYPRTPLNKRSLALHWGKGSAEYLPPEYGTSLVITADAD